MSSTKYVNIGEMRNISADNYIEYGERSHKTSIEKLREHVAAGALHNSAERGDAPKCHPETRVAVRDEVVSWVCLGDRDGVPKKIMWVTGPAGSGKTAIMGSVADTCQGKGILGATHFFSSFSGSANRRSKRYLVPTLAYQLVQHKAMAQVAEQILSTVEQNPVIFDQNLEAQLDQLILEPLRACQDHPELPVWPKVILIDGLDECEADQYHDTARSNAPLRSNEDDQTEILSILKRAANDPAFPFRIVIASRPEHTIKHFFNDIANTMTRELFLDMKYNPDADMALFLESKFANIRRQHSHLPSSWPSKDVRQTLITNASGQFIYVATVGRFMEGAGDPRLLLNQVLQLPGINTSATPFATLDALYTHILNPSQGLYSQLKIIWLNLLFREEYLDKPLQSSYHTAPATPVQSISHGEERSLCQGHPYPLADDSISPDASFILPSPMASSNPPSPMASSNLPSPMAPFNLPSSMDLSNLPPPVASSNLPSPVALHNLHSPMASSNPPSPVASSNPPSPVASFNTPLPIALSNPPAPVAWSTNNEWLSGGRPLAAVARVFLESYPGEASDVFRTLNSLVSIPAMGDDSQLPYTLYHKSLVDFLASPSRSGDLYIGPEVVSEFFVERYMEHWKSKGLDSLTSVEMDKFFMLFFSDHIIKRVFSVKSLSHFHRIALSCDAAWWVQSFLEVRAGEGWSRYHLSLLNRAFCDVHQTIE